MNASGLRLAVGPVTPFHPLAHRPQPLCFWHKKKLAGWVHHPL
jgi:hypothetical protein